MSRAKAVNLITIDAHLDEIVDTAMHISRRDLLLSALGSGGLWALILLVAARFW